MADSDSIPSSEASPFADTKHSPFALLPSSTTNAALSPYIIPTSISLPIKSIVLPISLPFPSNLPFPSPIIEEVASFPRIRTHGVEILPTTRKVPLSPPILSPARIEGFPSLPRKPEVEAGADAFLPLIPPDRKRRGKNEVGKGLRDREEKQASGEDVGSAASEEDGVGENSKVEERDDDSLEDLGLERLVTLKDTVEQQQRRKSSMGSRAGATRLSGKAARSRKNEIGNGKGEGDEVEHVKGEINEDGVEDQEGWYTPNEDASKNYGDIDGLNPRKTNEKVA